ncbi:hypothetical protein [Haloplanus natans]|uniref:hypothetical protein n=1 Tax=Haloplanus natans TaxID=376171 RepID=UPI000677D328|nr:hypothetical protein [Haloplanus natans]
MTKLTLREAVSHPATVASTLVAVVGGALNLPVFGALATVAWAKAASIFTALSVAGFSLAPRVAFLPEGMLTALAIAAGLLYVAKIAYGVYQNLDTRL